MNVRKRWKILPPRFHHSNFHVRADYRLLASGLGDHLAMRIDDPAAAEIDVFWIISGPIYAYDIREILNRPRFQQCCPMALAGEGPIGNHHEQIGASSDRHAKNLREPQVITD